VNRLLCVGDLILDVVITLGDDLAIGSDTAGTIEVHGGGSAANVAAWACRAGTPTRFVGAVGSDSIGEFLVDELEGHGVDVRAIRRDEARSRAVAAIVGPDGERSLVSDVDTIVAPSLDDFRNTWLEDVTWLHLTAYTYIAEHSRRLFSHITAAAAARSIPFSIDPSAVQLLRSHCELSDVRAAFAGAEVLFPNQDEAEYLAAVQDPGRAAEFLLDIAQCAVVTCGANGAYVARRGATTIHVDATTITGANTLGCGDAFAAGFIAGRLDGLDDRASARRATDSAASALQLPSAR
jgi:sugar/nucleoside kinase (ribokinase family)